jgi:4'-phosphopantetheinyl transferase
VVTVVILRAAGADPTALRTLVTNHVAAAYGDVTRLCPQCGSATHGRPHITGRHDLHVSISYADGLAVVAIADHPVGVDVEADGPAPSGFVDRAEWTRAEAALKLTGEGVRRDPWEPVAAGIETVPLIQLPAGYVGTLARWAGTAQPGNAGSAASYSQGLSSAPTS